MRTTIRHGKTVQIASDGTTRPTPDSRWRGVRGHAARACGVGLGNAPGAGEFGDGSGDYLILRVSVKSPDPSRRPFSVPEVLATIRDHARAS